MVNKIKLFSVRLISVHSFSRVSCSHVGHIYRGPRRRSMHPRGGNAYQSHINHLRVAEVLDFD
jgi:hypothetical protein